MLSSDDYSFSIPDGILIPMTAKDLDFLREICLESVQENGDLWNRLLDEALSRYSRSEVVFNMNYSKFPVEMTVAPVSEAQKSSREKTVAWGGTAADTAFQSCEEMMVARVVVQRGNGLQTVSFQVMESVV